MKPKTTNKKSKTPDDYVELEIDKTILLKVLAAAKGALNGYSDVAIRFTKEGMYLCQVDPAHVATCGIALSLEGEHVKNYRTIPGHEIVVSPEDTLGEMHEFIKATAGRDKTIQIRIDQTHIKINAGKARRRIKIHEWTEDVQKNTFNALKKCHNITKGYKRMITVKSSELAYVIKNFATMDGNIGSDCFSLIADGESFKIFRDLEINDNVEVDLKDMKVGRATKQDYKGKFPLDYLYSAIRYLAPLTEQLTITGESDCPVLLSGSKAPVPEKDPGFDQDIDFWFVLAPRIEEE